MDAMLILISVPLLFRRWRHRSEWSYVFAPQSPWTGAILILFGAIALKRIAALLGISLTVPGPQEPGLGFFEWLVASTIACLTNPLVIVASVVMLAYGIWWSRLPCAELIAFLRDDPELRPRRRCVFAPVAAMLQCLPLLTLAAFQSMKGAFDLFQWAGSGSVNPEDTISYPVLLIAVLLAIALAFAGPYLWGIGYLYLGDSDVLTRWGMLLLIGVGLPTLLTGELLSLVYHDMPWLVALVCFVGALDAWRLARALHRRDRPERAPSSPAPDTAGATTL